jgi:hypothetical protein
MIPFQILDDIEEDINGTERAREKATNFRGPGRNPADAS